MKNTRKDFIKKSTVGLVGLAGAGVSACASSSASVPVANRSQAERIWQMDPEWLEVKYGDWGGPGVSARPGPMDTMLLKDYAPKSSVVARETRVQKARYPAIDVHGHVYARTPEDIVDWLKTMDEVGIDLTVILTGATGTDFDRLVDMYLKPYPDRFQLYCGLERNGVTRPNYSERAVDELVRCCEKGARGVGELSDKGLGFSRDSGLARNVRLHPDDDRLNAFWSKCAELDLPVNIHIADHPSAWQPLDVFQERTPDFQHFNLYEDDILSYEELLIVRNRLLQKHPDTTFIACHMSNQGNDLEALGQTLDKYSNLYLDISARDYEIGRMPRASAKFMTDYSDRILWGADMGRRKKMYQSWWRLLETADEYMVGRVWWPYYGLELPASVLESLYRGNAKRIMNWTSV